MPNDLGLFPNMNELGLFPNIEKLKDEFCQVGVMFRGVSSAPRILRVECLKRTALALTFWPFQRALGLGLSSPKALVAAAA